MYGQTLRLNVVPTVTVLGKKILGYKKRAIERQLAAAEHSRSKLLCSSQHVISGG
ncbi:hypothetical protein CFOL_v3_30898 [Cephalotus follicularis]|uniref:Uncharacterized protein n=1 Tax=Cephalotus follicularis TaxID=3775 RepID=A0A1Q3D4U3_CEPFO|nr:hypothetical protein CFOL_v3_30898 [Cephalotus follicularis]